MDRPFSLRELREAISNLGEWDVDAAKITMMVPDAAKGGRDRRDDPTTLPLRPLLFVHEGDALVFRGPCLVDLDALSRGDVADRDIESYVAGWIERAALVPEASLRAEVSILPRAQKTAPLVAQVVVVLVR